MVAVCFPADQKIGPGDRFLVKELAKVRRTVEVRGGHQDRPGRSPSGSPSTCMDIAALGAETGTDWAEIVPVSAVSR